MLPKCKRGLLYIFSSQRVSVTSWSYWSRSLLWYRGFFGNAVVKKHVSGLPIFFCARAELLDPLRPLCERITLEWLSSGKKKLWICKRWELNWFELKSFFESRTQHFWSMARMAHSERKKTLSQEFLRKLFAYGLRL